MEKKKRGRPPGTKNKDTKLKEPKGQHGKLSPWRAICGPDIKLVNVGRTVPAPFWDCCKSDDFKKELWELCLTYLAK